MLRQVGWWALFVSLCLLVLALTSPVRADPPCGPWHDLCVEALTDAGVDPAAWMPPDYDVQWIIAFGHVMFCESRYDAAIVGEVDSGDRGLWQINRRYWPDVSDAQAFDPVFSMHWAAQQCFAKKLNRQNII